MECKPGGDFTGVVFSLKRFLGEIFLIQGNRKKALPEKNENGLLEPYAALLLGILFPSFVLKGRKEVH